MTTNRMLADAEERMKKAVEAARHELASIRTGKASPSLLDTIKVEAYGTSMSLQQLGTVSAPEARLLLVQPFDKGTIKAITRAIQQSELGLSPIDDGIVIRVPIPTLTEERRKDMVKLIAKLAEEGRVHLRQVRHEVNHDLKAKEKSHEIPEDDARRLTADVQKLTDRYVGTIDELLKKKTAEVMEV